MRYVDFRDSICRELRRNANGLTWSQLKERLRLPYQGPCPEWVSRMEEENGLTRTPGRSRALVWRLKRKLGGDSAR